MNLQGSIDLLRLEKTGVVTIKGKRCVIIPIEENDIYISADQTNPQKAKAAYLSINALERREPSQFGMTHYIKQSLSKAYRDAHPQEAEAKKNVYFGDMKPLEFQSTSQASTINAPTMEVEDSDLPF